MAGILYDAPMRSKEYTVLVNLTLKEEALKSHNKALHALHEKSNPFHHGVIVGEFGETWRQRANAKPLIVTRSKYKDPYD